jgi:hypothetical protein
LIHSLKQHPDAERWISMFLCQDPKLQIQVKCLINLMVERDDILIDAIRRELKPEPGAAHSSPYVLQKERYEHGANRTERG